MALINCTECGREVSDKAASCPTCGAPINTMNTKKFCKHCASPIDKECIVCPRCGKQVENLASNNDRNIIINNVSSASASAAVTYAPTYYGRAINKWISLALCIFTICGHKFYEGKIGMGILYICTVGLFGIGWIVDIITILLKPNPYYV